MATSFTDQDDYYTMDASPKGICLIMNNFEFDRSPRLDTGPADKENLTRTFKKMDFEVRYFENQTCAQMKTRMENIQKEDHSNYDCFVCCISSHGNKTGVCGADDYTVNISELQEYVFSTQCRSLARKPKVFFVDACRGGEGQKGHCLARSGAPTRPVVITDKRDFLVSFATTPDNKSYCNPDSTKGAVYFYHLTRLLEHYANSKTIMHILHKLNEALTVESTAHKLQTAQYESTLAKELRFYCPVQAMVRALQQELTQARSRVQVLEREVKRKDDQIKQHLQGEKARYQNTAKQLTHCKKTCSALDKELQGEKARHQDTTNQLQDCNKTCSALEKDVASYQRQLRELQNKALRFHDNHGKHVVLSNNHQTAVFNGLDFIGGGIVLSRDPIEVNKVYEVHITKRGRGSRSLVVGVVTSSPDRLTLPHTATGWKSAVTIYSACFFDHGDGRDSDVGKAMGDLPVDSRVGVSLDPSRSLHLHVNGTDQGVVPCRSLPDQCWAMWEVNSTYKEITSLPVRDLP